MPPEGLWFVGDLVPDCVVHIDWAAAKPCHGVGEELAGAV